MDRNSNTVLEEMYEIMRGMEVDKAKWEESDTKSAAARLRKSTTKLDKLGKEFRKLSIAEAKS